MKQPSRGPDPSPGQRTRLAAELVDDEPAPGDECRFQLSTLGGLVAVVLWSTTFALARRLSEQVGSLKAGAAVYLFGGAFCLARLGTQWMRGRAQGFSRKYVLGCGGLFLLYSTLIYVAVGLAQDREQLLEVALINYLWPAATVLLSLPLLQQRGGWLLLPGTLLALAGVFLVMTQGPSLSWAAFEAHFQSNPVAYILVFVAAMAWALYSNLTRRWLAPGSAAAVDLFIPVTGIVLLTLSLLQPHAARWHGREWIEAAALGAITALAYSLWEEAMRHGNLLLVVACSYATPLLSTLVSCLYLRLLPGSRLWIGCGLLVLGSLLTWKSVSGTPGPAPRGHGCEVSEKP